MHTLKRSAIVLAICLAALAGCVDVIGFLQLGGYFISFMSGNSTQLAVGLVAKHMSGVMLPAALIALFVIGTMLGTWVGHFSKGRSHVVCVLAFVTGLLAASAFCYGMQWIFPTIILMTLAMGAENAVFQRNGDVVVGLTYMTGTLVKVGQRLANALLGGAKFAWVPYLLLWLGLILGGTIGALLFHALGLYSLWAAAAWSLMLTFAARFSKDSLPS